MSSQGLDDLLLILDHEYSFSLKKSAYLSALKKNTVTEFWCIVACEVGQISSSFGWWALGSEYWNELGFAGGIISGLAYAFAHTYRHAKKHNKKVDVGEAVKYVLSAETGCVVAATTTEYLAVNLSNATIPHDPTALLYGVSALPFAFAIGLNVMTAFTYGGNTKLGSFIAKKKKMEDLYSTLEKNMHTKRKNKKMVVEGLHNKLVIKEKDLPTKLSMRYPSQEYALYKIHSPIKRYDSRGAEQAFNALLSLV